MRRRFYLSVTAKFAIAQAVALAWLGISVWLSIPWLVDLAGPSRSCRRS